MNKSLYTNFVKKYFKGIVLKRTLKAIGSEDKPSDYAHLRMLGKIYSVDGSWENVISEHSNVSANIVAMDSPLPLKSRDVIGSASGKIPKQGMKMALNETQARAIDIMQAEGGDELEIAKKLFDDTERCMNGVHILNEYIFWRGFSTGEVLIEDSENGGINVGQGIFADFGYLTDQKSGVPIVWGNAGYTPITDFRNALTKAEDKGKYPTLAWMTEGTLNKMRTSDESKDLYATYVGNFGTSRPIPTRSQFISAFADEFSGIEIRVVKKSLRFEINGKKQVEKPFEEGNIVLNNSERVGALVWSKVPEMNPNRHVAGVAYQVSNDYMLLKKFSKTDPLQEFTASEAFVLPVITEVEDIFLIETQTLQA